jgi:hypothetical protein
VPLKVPSLQRTTDAGQPNWIGGKITTQQGQESPDLLGRNDLGTVAYVPNNGNAISVTRPSLYDLPTAAHEATHVFQNTRNDQFQDLESRQMPSSTSLTNYDYGGIKGLQSNPLKSVANYNPEQQAEMVEDLTAAQGKLTPKMSPKQLQDWDTTKTTLERPIRQLAAVPAKDTSIGGRIDRYFDLRGFGDPIAKVKGILSPPSINMAPQSNPEAPSVALGYANRSKLVR